ncbi:MAG: hypothetical protein J7L34_07305 [Thermotogaceae bacterium]|nr:hypothetical protein [Thermotogaceae bacterium]
MDRIDELKNSINSLRSEMKEGFKDLRIQLSDLRKDLEERKIVNGKQDVRLDDQSQDINELRKAFTEYQKQFQKFIEVNLKEHQALQQEITKQTSKFKVWTAGFAISVLGGVSGFIAIILHFI